MSGLTPTGIHILDADGHVLQNDLRDRKYGRGRARELSSDGSRVYLVDPEFDPRVTPYVDGCQAGDFAIASIPSIGVTRAAESSVTDAPISSDTTLPPRTSSDEAEPAGALPELLRPGLDLVIVGLNPGAESARVGHYYWSRRNDFWTMLSESGLAGGVVDRGDDQLLLDRGIGLTDVVRTRAESDSTKIRPPEIRHAARDFEHRIADAGPRRVCFNGEKHFKWVFRVLCPRFRRLPDSWGLQPVRIASAEVWLMPSTSRRNKKHYHHHTRRVLRELAQALGRTAPS